jgi:predicted Zn-dependent protease
MKSIEELAATVLSIVGDRAEAEVSINGGTHALTRFANSFIHQNVAEEGESVTIKVAVDGRVTSATTTSTSPDALVRFVDETIEAAKLQPVDDGWPGLTPPTEVPFPDHYDEDTATATPADRAAFVKEFIEAAPGMRAAGYVETIGGEGAFANSAGHHTSGRYSRAVVDGIHQTDTSAGSGHRSSVAMADINASEVGAEAADRARRSETTFDIKPGEYEVVLSPECLATVAVFLAFYGFNGKTHAEGQSFAVVGEQQFDPAFQLWDDAPDPRTMALGFDSEGTPRRRVALVSDGTTVSLAQDRRTAVATGTASTGHAFPGSEVMGPFPQNMFIGPGTTSVDDLIASVDRGLYVSTFNYCRVLDPKSMAVTGLTRNGTFMIENGKITGAVSGLRFTQSFVEGLGSGRILGIGSDARFADSEFGPAIVHTPSMRLAGWNFTGGIDG